MEKEQRCCSECSNLKSIDDFRVDRKYITYTCKACYSTYQKQYRKTNKLKIKQQKDLWYQEHKHLVVERYHNDMQNKLTRLLRNRLYSAIKNNRKDGSAIKDLGCNVSDFKIYLESKFQEGMSWDNWSKYGWHIDHIIPLANFDLTDKEQLKKACHYTNLQPLWAKDNWSKGDKC